MIATLFTVPCMRCEIQRHPAHRVSMRVFHTTVLERHNHPLRSWLEIPGVFASCLKPRGCSQVDKGRKSPENFRKKGPPREQTDKRHRPFPNEFLASSTSAVAPRAGHRSLFLVRPAIRKKNGRNLGWLRHQLWLGKKKQITRVRKAYNSVLVFIVIEKPNPTARTFRSVIRSVLELKWL